MALEEEEVGLTFSLDVNGDGASALRSTIINKLSDFMGSYTDDVLAEYVVVLVGHGKHRAQAVKDLEAFLGDRSEAFVTWLWDHLGSNMHLYMGALTDSPLHHDTADIVKESLEQGESKDSVKSSNINAEWQEKSQQEPLPSAEGVRSITLRREGGKTTEIRSRKDMVIATLRAAQAESSGLTRSQKQLGKRQRSPDSRPLSETVISEKQKRHVSPSQVSATRRLLQSAVREAVAPATGHSKRLPVREGTAPVREPVAPALALAAGHSNRSESSKRWQSIVSADFENSEMASVQQPLKDARGSKAVRQGKRPMPAIMMAVKAAAAAAEDVTKLRGRLTGNIWDRLGRKAVDSVDSKDEEHARYGEESEDVIDNRYTSHYEDEQDHKRPRLESDDMLSEGSIEDDAAVSGSVFDDYTGQSASSRNLYSVRGNKYQEERNRKGFASDDDIEEGEDIRAKDRRRRSREESVTVEYRLARNMEGAKKESHKQKGSGASSGLANSSQKIVNISVNVNTWKPAAYEKVKDTGCSEQTTNLPQEQMENVVAANMISAPSGNEMGEGGDDDMHIMAAKKIVREAQPEVNNVFARQSETVKEAVKTVSSGVSVGAKQGRKPDDAEARTVFVTNIHFAASKESVMAHFAPCGDIGKIIMLTDGATGQPKGSAYIEFKTKDATDRALALNESSFYSRALKVVRKDAAIQAIQGINPLIHPALIRHSLPLALRLPIRARLLRGAPYLLQHRFPAVPRPFGNFPSLQWKRDGATGGVNPTVLHGKRPGFNAAVRPGRSLSYVRSSNTSGAQPVKPGEALMGVPPQGEKDEVKLEVGIEDAEKETGDVQMVDA